MSEPIPYVPTEEAVKHLEWAGGRGADPSECRFCRWWTDTYRATPKHTPGRQPYNDAECRRYAPISIPDGWKKPYWPRTQGSDGCGDFERFRDADGAPNTASHTPGA